MIVLFILVVAALGVTIYLTVVLGAVPGAVDERLGRLEEMPENVGEWIVDRSSEAGRVAENEGLVRETRVLHEPARGVFGRESFLLQARCRDADGKIVRVEPEQRLKRKRRKV